MLGFAGNAIDKLHVPRLLQTGGPPPPDGFWYRWSRFVQRRAWVTGTVAVLVLVALALPLFSMRLAFTDAGNDPTNLTTRQAYDLLAQGFGPGFNGPLIIAAAMHGPAGATADVATVDHLQQAITASAHHDGIAFVAPPEFNKADTGAVIVVYPTTSPQSAQTGRWCRRSGTRSSRRSSRAPPSTRRSAGRRPPASMPPTSSATASSS